MKKKALLTILCVITLISLSTAIFLRPSYFSLSAGGTEMQKDGTAVGERDIEIAGWQLNPLFGDESFLPVSLHLEGTPFALYNHSARSVWECGSSVWMTQIILLDQLNRPRGCQIFWTEDRSSFAVFVADKYFVYSDTMDDPTALALFQSFDIR